MTARAVPAMLILLGAIALAGALLLVASAKLAPYEGLQDLGRIVGALLLAAASGLLFGIGLVAARLATASLPRWLVGIGVGGTLVALIPAMALLQPALSASNWALGGFALVVLLAGVAGLASAPGAWRQRA